MNKLLACLTLLLWWLPALANPFPKGDPKAGKSLMEAAKCDACHASLYGGDGTKIYTRPDRRVKSPQGLLSQVQFCATQLKVSWFPEEVENVAAYLNEKFYKFK